MTGPLWVVDHMGSFWEWKEELMIMILEMLEVYATVSIHISKSTFPTWDITTLLSHILISQMVST